MRKLLTTLFICFSLSAFSQQKQDSAVLVIKIDTGSYKILVSLIHEKFETGRTSDALILNQIFSVLQIAAFTDRKKLEEYLYPKPKEIKTENKPK